MIKTKKIIKYESPKIINKKKVRTNLLTKKGYNLDDLITSKHLLS